jgi:hypothetical protein
MDYCCQTCKGTGGITNYFDGVIESSEPCPDCTPVAKEPGDELPDLTEMARERAELDRFLTMPAIQLCRRDVLYEFLAAYWPDELHILNTHDAAIAALAAQVEAQKRYANALMDVIEQATADINDDRYGGDTITDINMGVAAAMALLASKAGV